MSTQPNTAQSPRRFIFQHQDGLCPALPISAFCEDDARASLAQYVKSPAEWSLLGCDDYACPADAKRNAAIAKVTQP